MTLIVYCLICRNKSGACIAPFNVLFNCLKFDGMIHKLWYDAARWINRQKFNLSWTRHLFQAEKKKINSGSCIRNQVFQIVSFAVVVV